MSTAASGGVSPSPRSHSCSWEGEVEVWESSVRARTRASGVGVEILRVTPGRRGGGAGDLNRAAGRGRAEGRV